MGMYVAGIEYDNAYLGGVQLDNIYSEGNDYLGLAGFTGEFDDLPAARNFPRGIQTMFNYGGQILAVNRSGSGYTVDLASNNFTNQIGFNTIFNFSNVTNADVTPDLAEFYYSTASDFFKYNQNTEVRTQLAQRTDYFNLSQTGSTRFARCEGLAYSGSTLYAILQIRGVDGLTGSNRDFRLYTINITDGTATRVGTATNLGRPSNFSNVRDMTWADGELIFLQSGSNQNVIWRLDPSTGSVIGSALTRSTTFTFAGLVYIGTDLYSTDFNGLRRAVRG